MKPKILFLNVTGSTNKGDMSVIIGHINCIRNLWPEAEITIWSGNIDVDKFFERFGVKVQKHPWYRRKRSWLLTVIISLFLVTFAFIKKLFYLVAQRLNKNWRDPLSKYDLVLDTLADRLNEPFHGFWECIFVLLITFLAYVLIRKPIVIGPTSIGPLTSRVTRWMAYHILNRVDGISLREARSRGYLSQLGICKPRVQLSADMAFLLDPAPSDRIEAILEKARLETGNKPLIGTSPRWFIWRNRSEQCYIQLVAEMIDFLIEKLNAQVCLIPHSQEILYAKGIPSDNEVNQKIKSLVKNKQALFLIPDTIDPMEAKGIILRCDLFISWKLHTTIAAVSSGKPTCCIYYGDKMKSIFGEMMGQREYQIDIRSHSPEQLLNEIKLKCQKLWSHRAEVTKELVTRTRVVKELTISHSELIRTIIKNSSSKQ